MNMYMLASKQEEDEKINEYESNVEIMTIK